MPGIIGARRVGDSAMAPLLWSCNKVLKPNFQFVISQNNNGCSLLSHILAKILLLGISCENVFALSIMPALTACPFAMKSVLKGFLFNEKRVKMLFYEKSFFYEKRARRLGPQTLLVSGGGG